MIENFYDIPSFVISLPNSNRRELCKSRLDEQGIEFEWFDGINVDDTPQSVFDDEKITLTHKSSKGCALAHKRLWQYIVNNNIKQAIIYEDDIVFHPRFNDVGINFFWKYTPKVNSMIFMGYCCFWAKMGERHILSGFPLATHAYYLTCDVAKWFLDNFDICDQNIDIHMRKLYNTVHHDWKSYVWWEGDDRVEGNKQTKLGVCFNGLIFQDHENQ